jgi:hypothetical protein
MRIFVGNRVHPGTTGLHIQARPQAWVAALGSVPVLKPSGGMVTMMQRLVAERKAGKPLDEKLFAGYRLAYETMLKGLDLSPGKLLDANGDAVGINVTLICTCSREEAAAGRCHRKWATVFLEAAGWECFVDWQVENG